MTDWQDSLQGALSRKREKYFPEFLSIAKDLISATMATLEGGDSGAFDGEPDRHKVTTPLTESNIVGSEITTHARQTHKFVIDDEKREAGVKTEVELLHKPVLDIDLPIWAKESTTEGHWHLIIDKEMTWNDYKKLLYVMRDVGILEDGFVKAAVSRGGSWIRTPWTKKEIEK